MPKEKIILYTIDDDTIFKYFLKIEADRKIISNLLFEEDTFLALNKRDILCEGFALLSTFEYVLEEIVDDNNRDPATNSYLTTEAQAVQISIYMEGLVQIKESLASQGISLYLH